MLSATSEVSKLSMAPSNARINAASSAMKTVSCVNAGITSEGNPVGMSPSTGAPGSARLSNVPVTSAASGAGMIFPQLCGQLKIMTRQTTPTVSAAKFGSITASGTAVRAGIVPLPSGSCPNRRESWSAMMIQPMPLMNPEITG